MSEGPKRTTVGRTIYNGHMMTFTLPGGGVIEIETHGGRQRWHIRVPPGVVVGTPEFRDVRNQDDRED